MTSKIKTYFEKVVDWFKEIGHSATWEETALTALKVAAPLLDTLVALTLGEPAAAAVSKVVSQAQSDLAATAALLQGAQTSSGSVTISSLLGSVKANLSTLLADADVKNSAKAADITVAVNTVIGEVEAIASAMPQQAAA